MVSRQKQVRRGWSENLSVFVEKPDTSSWLEEPRDPGGQVEESLGDDFGRCFSNYIFLWGAPRRGPSTITEPHGKIAQATNGGPIVIFDFPVTIVLKVKKQVKKKS